MATTAAIIEVLVRVNTANATADMSRFNSTLDRSGRTAKTAVRDHDRLNRTTGKLSDTMKNAAKAGVAAAGAYVSIAAAKDAVETTTDLFQAMINLKKGFGLSAKAASGFNAIVLSRGGEVSATAGAFRTLAKQVEEAKAGSESASKAFRALGVSTGELKNLNKDQLLFELADGMANLDDKTRRSAASATLFGRTAQKEVIPALRGGSAALREQIALAEDAGATFSDSGSIKNMKELTAAQRELEIRTLGLQVQFTKHLAPALIDIIQWFGKAGRNVRKFLDEHNAVPQFIKGFMLIPRAIGRLTKVFFDLQKLGIKVFAKIGNAAGDVGHAFGRLGSKMAGVAKTLAGPVIKAAAAIRHALTWIVNAVRRVVGAFGDLKEAVPDINLPDLPNVGDITGQRGLMVPGSGSGDKVRAMLEPGEVVINKKAVAAMGGQRRVNRINQAVPRFAKGGQVGRPTITGGGVMGRVAQSSSDMARLAVNAWLKKHMGPGANWESIDALARKLGLDRGTLTGRIGQPNSRHGIMGPGGRAMATDYSGPIFGSRSGPMAEFTRKLIPLAQKGSVNELFYDPLGGWDSGSSIGAIGNHDDHVHVALRKGGPVRGTHWIHPQNRSRWTASEAATLLWQVGASASEARLLSRKVAGESAGNPRARGHDPGGTTGLGLWQITTGYNDDLIRRYSPIMNPQNNAKAALAILRRQGIGAWYASSGAAGEILRERVFNPQRLLADKSFTTQRDAVRYLMKFGFSKKEAIGNYAQFLSAKGGGTPGKKKKGKPGAPGAAAGVVDESMVDRLAAANELIGAGNLLNLQNFNTGMAQHPLLGIPNPAAAKISPFISSFGGGLGAEQNMIVRGQGGRTPSVHSPKTGGPRASQHLQPVIIVEDGAVDAKRIRRLGNKEARQVLRRAGRRANRRLPSGGGGGP